MRPGIEFLLESVIDEAVQFGPDGEAENILGDCSEHSRHVDGWTTKDAAAVERHEAMVVSSALAEASNTTVLTKPLVLDQLVFDSGERGSDGAQDLLKEHLQQAEVNEECASETACVADEDLRRAWAASFEMSVGDVLWALDSQAAAPALGEEPIRGSLMNVSLVAEFDKEFRKRRAIFVNWKRYRVQGQTVETDESDRLIFSMALRYPYRALEHAQVLVPDCGVVMEKVKKERRSADPFSLSRPTVPAHACRLQQMFECATMGRDWVTEGADASGRAALCWGSHGLPQSRCVRCLAAIGVRKMPQARGTRERFYHPLFFVFALLAPSLCQNVCKIHGGTGRVAAVKQAEEERMERSGHVLLSLHCEQTHCLCELCRVCSAPTLF